MITHLQRTALSLVIGSLFFVSIKGQASDEFHFGYGGFSIKAGGVPSAQKPVADKLDEYVMWGNSFTWVRNNYRLKISVCSVGKGNTIVVRDEKPILISKLKMALAREMDPKGPLEEKPCQFAGSTGIEIKSPKFWIARILFVKELLFVIQFEAENADDLMEFKPIIDSFRSLTKTERTLAMISEFTPPTLAQDHTTGGQWTDATEFGLKGAVCRIRETTEPSPRSETQVIQEQHFDLDGFLTIEIGFNNGFPDVITGWGWYNNKRVNIQSAVNYPPGEGPIGGRAPVVSGYLTVLPGYVATVNGSVPKYGNRIEMDFDSSSRLLERRRYANAGSLVLAERYSYSGNIREIKTIDDSGGFMGHVRERLDANNNVIERQVLLGNGQVFNSTTFEYQFDEKGNWIVKKTFGKSVTGRRTAAKPMGVFYRDVQYYGSPDLKLVG